MNARLLFILLIFSVLLAFTAKFRRVGIVLSVVLLLLLIGFNITSTTAVNDGKPSTQPSTMTAAKIQSPSRATVSLPIATVQLTDMQLNGSGAPWQLSGRVSNADHESVIKSFTLRVTRLDCPTTLVASADCSLNWQGEHTVHMQLAPNATQSIDEAIWSHDAVPRLKGVARFDIVVTDVQGKAAS
jgi:hypothetical protein